MNPLPKNMHDRSQLSFSCVLLMPSTSCLHVKMVLPEAIQITNHLDQICNVHWHFVNLGTVVLFDIPKDAYIVISNKVDRHTLASISS